MNHPATSVAEASVAVTEDDNPFMTEWETPFAIPPFEEIRDEHYRPAFERGIEELRARVRRIKENPEPPSFDNTVTALETSSPLLDRMMKVFRNFTSTDVNEVLRELRLDFIPRITREFDAILLDGDLFRRIEAVWQQRDRLALDEQDARLLELTRRDFVRAGAALDAPAKARLAELNTRLAELTTRFSQNLLAETKSFALVVDDEADLAGLPPHLVRSAKATAEARGRPGTWVFGLDRSVFETFMTHAENRELRRRLLDGYRHRGAAGGANDNRRLLLEVVRLRAERAELLGYPSHAHYVLETSMTKTPERALELLLRVWEPGLERAREELAEMQRIAGENEIQAWDWWYYAEKLRRERYDLDDSEIKPYLELANARQGAFHAAGRLFGLTFERLHGLPAWNPQVAAYDVRDRQGRHLGVFMTDDFARSSKRDGAWMDNYREASDVDGDGVRPVVVNIMNLIEPGEGEPALLAFEEVETLFHEFGHALHGLMTRARYERFSGTSGSPRDFVEFPSQFMEHYAVDPGVLAVYARHWRTGEAMPAELMDKLRKARRHNQGFKTTEYIAAALVDLAWHTLSAEEAAAVTDCRAFEKKVLREHGLIAEIEPRYRSPYFGHIFTSAMGYSAGYFAYLWSEALDADAFAAFEERGDVFDPELAKRLAENVYEAGYVAPGDELYRRFRGADPSVDALLRQRGFASARL